MSLVVLATRIARRTLDALLVLLIALIGGTLLIARIAPAVAGGQTFVVGGGSMEPTIPLGAAVLTVPVAASDLRPGDVVSLQVGPQRALFTHRIARLVDLDDGLYLATKGDGNEQADPSLVPASAVIGRVHWHLPYAGYGIALLGSVSGVAFALALAALLLAGAWLLESLEDDKRAARRRAAGASPAAGTPGAAW